MPGAGFGRTPALEDVRQLDRSAQRLADPAHALRVRIDDADRPELVERALGRHRRGMDPLPDERHVPGQRERRPVVEDRHRDVLDGSPDAVRNGRRGRRADDVRLADEAERSGTCPPPAPSTWYAWTVRPRSRPRCPRARRSRAGRRCGARPTRRVVGVPERGIDDLGVGAVVLVDLEADGPGVDQRVEWAVLERPGVGLKPDVDRPTLERLKDPLHGPWRLDETGPDQRRHAARQRGGHEGRADRVDVAVDRPRSGDIAVAHERHGQRADRQVDAFSHGRVAGHD